MKEQLGSNWINIKGMIWALAIFFLVFSFPLQVYTNTPYPALIPYLIILPLIGFTIALQGKRGPFSVANLVYGKTKINLMINIYLALLAFNTTWQYIFKVVNFNDSLSAIVIYFLPVFFYWYFRKLSSELEISWVLKAMAWAGIIVGIFFVYDSNLKYGLKHVSDFASQAFNYSSVRSNGLATNISRINIGSRSYGLLQTHSVSGAWVLIGMLSTLALEQENKKKLRIAVMGVFGLMLLAALNFTSILCYIVILFITELGGFSLFRTSLKRLMLSLFFIIILALMFICVGKLLLDPKQYNTIKDLFYYQFQFLFGMGGKEHLGKMSMALDSLKIYFQHIKTYPLTLIFGDGFSSFGFVKGGDVGFVGTMAKLGMVFYSACIIGFLKLILKWLKFSKYNNRSADFYYLNFAIAIILLVNIADAHYSIWIAKSILPIIFFALALCERYFPVNLKE